MDLFIWKKISKVCYFVLVLCLPACTGNQTFDDTFSKDLPASYVGTLPYADCSGVEHHLFLYPDQVFFHRKTFLGEDKQIDNIGRWELSSDKQTLSLNGGHYSPVRLAKDYPRALTMLDTEGQRVGSPLNVQLARTATLKTFTPKLFMKGMYQY